MLPKKQASEEKRTSKNNEELPDIRKEFNFSLVKLCNQIYITKLTKMENDMEGSAVEIEQIISHAKKFVPKCISFLNANKSNELQWINCTSTLILIVAELLQRISGINQPKDELQEPLLDMKDEESSLFSLTLSWIKLMKNEGKKSHRERMVQYVVHNFRLLSSVSLENR